MSVRGHSRPLGYRSAVMRLANGRRGNPAGTGTGRSAPDDREAESGPAADLPVDDRRSHRRVRRRPARQPVVTGLSVRLVALNERLDEGGVVLDTDVVVRIDAGFGRTRSLVV